jgi:hypothetical protein
VTRPAATASATPASQGLIRARHRSYEALLAAGCQRIFVDRAGKTTARPGLDELLAQLRRGDTLVMWRLDRLGRSLRHLVDTVAHLDERGVSFVTFTESIDPSTPGGRLGATELDHPPEGPTLRKADITGSEGRRRRRAFYAYSAFVARNPCGKVAAPLTLPADLNTLEGQVRSLVVAAATVSLSMLMPSGVANAVYNDDQVICSSGPSGAACTRYQWDPAGPNSRTRGSADPATNYWITINTVQLHELYYDSFGWHDYLARQAYGSYSTTFQAVYTSDYRQSNSYCSNYYGYMTYSTYYGSYYEQTATSGQKCPTV